MKAQTTTSEKSRGGINARLGELPAVLHPEQRLWLAQVETLIGNGGSWIYPEIKAGRFPEPERDGPRNSRWRAGDVLDWLEAKRAKAVASAAAAAEARASSEPAGRSSPRGRRRADTTTAEAPA